MNSRFFSFTMTQQATPAFQKKQGFKRCTHIPNIFMHIRNAWDVNWLWGTISMQKHFLVEISWEACDTSINILSFYIHKFIKTVWCRGKQTRQVTKKHTTSTLKHLQPYIRFHWLQIYIHQVIIKFSLIKHITVVLAQSTNSIKVFVSCLGVKQEMCWILLFFKSDSIW